MPNPSQEPIHKETDDRRKLFSRRRRTGSVALGDSGVLPPVPEKPGSLQAVARLSEAIVDEGNEGDKRRRLGRETGNFHRVIDANTAPLISFTNSAGQVEALHSILIVGNSVLAVTTSRQPGMPVSEIRLGLLPYGHNATNSSGHDNNSLTTLDHVALDPDNNAVDDKLHNAITYTEYIKSFGRDKIIPRPSASPGELDQTISNTHLSYEVESNGRYIIHDIGSAGQGSFNGTTVISDKDFSLPESAGGMPQIAKDELTVMLQDLQDFTYKWEVATADHIVVPQV